MDYLRLDPAIDSDPALEEAGWWATRVYELLLKISAMRDLRGRIPAECQRPAWLAKRWGLPANLDAEDILPGCLDALVAVGKLQREDDGALVISGWKKWYPTPKTGAERTAAWRDRQRSDDRDDRDECDEGPSQAVTVTDTYSTPPHPTPPDTSRSSSSTSSVGPRTGAAAGNNGVDPGKLWEAIQASRTAHGLEAEGASPMGWTAWVRQSAQAAGENAQERILAAHAVFLSDAKAKRLRSNATKVFCSDSIWRSRLPAKVLPSPPKPVSRRCAKCGAVTTSDLFGSPCCPGCKAEFLKLRRSAAAPDPDPAAQEAAMRTAATAWLATDTRGAA